MSDPHGVIHPNFYGESYWNGDVAVQGGYHGCNWDGWDRLIVSIKELFGCTSFLDAGCGLGPLVAEARRQGLESSGFDYSAEAIRHSEVDGLRVLDLTAGDFPESFYKFHCVGCFSVLEHLPLDWIYHAAKNLEKLAARGILMIRVDLLDSEWPEAEGLNTNSFRFDATRDHLDTPIAKALLASGHQTVMPYEWWASALEKSISMRRRPDLEAAVLLRCGHYLRWPNFFLFTDLPEPKRQIVWGFDRVDNFSDSFIYERIHFGNIVGLSGFDNCRDQYRRWNDLKLPSPAFMCQAHSIDSITARYAHLKDVDFILVTDDLRSPPPPWKKLSSDWFRLVRCRPYY